MGIDTFVLPEYVACYAMYGEPTGDDDLESAYDKWLGDIMEFYGWRECHLVDVKDNGFMAWHELRDYGIGSSDTSKFLFDVKLEQNP